VLDELTDGDLLARCRSHAPGSRERAAAFEVLVRRYTPLVRAVVRQYRDSPEPAEDLIQVGYLGLLKAIINYDPRFGNGLRAYAMPCITGEIKRYFRDKCWQVRVTRSLQEPLLEMRGATEDLTNELGRLPHESELAGRLGVTPEELREARQAGDAFSALSLNAPAGYEEGSAELGDLLGLEDAAVERTVDNGGGSAALGRVAPPRAADPHPALLRQPYAGRDRRPAGPVPDARFPPPGAGPGPAPGPDPRPGRPARAAGRDRLTLPARHPQDWTTPT
jgi:RNA polymerase sigma factor (sigma-70 family)